MAKSIRTYELKSYNDMDDKPVDITKRNVRHVRNLLRRIDAQGKHETEEDYECVRSLTYINKKSDDAFNFIELTPKEFVKAERPLRITLSPIETL